MSTKQSMTLETSSGNLCKMGLVLVSDVEMVAVEVGVNGVSDRYTV